LYVKVGREDVFKPRIGNKSLHEISDDNGVTLINFATSKNMIVRGTMFPHCNIYKSTWTSSDGNTYSQTDHILIEDRYSSVSDIRPFKGADCDTDHCLVVTKLKEKLPVCKQHSAHILYGEVQSQETKLGKG
jgi:hypothetical protein